MTHVSAGTVQLAVVIDVEVDDVDRAAAVVLDNLIRSMVRSSTDDPGLLARYIFFDRECILADILPPDKLDQC